MVHKHGHGEWLLFCIGVCAVVLLMGTVGGVIRALRKGGFRGVPAPLRSCVDRLPGRGRCLSARTAPVYAIRCGAGVALLAGLVGLLKAAERFFLAWDKDAPDSVTACMLACYSSLAMALLLTGIGLRFPADSPVRETCRTASKLSLLSGLCMGLGTEVVCDIQANPEDVPKDWHEGAWMLGASSGFLLLGLLAAQADLAQQKALQDAEGDEGQLEGQEERDIEEASLDRDWSQDLEDPIHRPVLARAHNSPRSSRGGSRPKTDVAASSGLREPLLAQGTPQGEGPPTDSFATAASSRSSEGGGGRDSEASLYAGRRSGASDRHDVSDARRASSRSLRNSVEEQRPLNPPSPGGGKSKKRKSGSSSKTNSPARPPSSATSSSKSAVSKSSQQQQQQQQREAAAGRASEAVAAANIRRGAEISQGSTRLLNEPGRPPLVGPSMVMAA
eukprot:TRINITY_DN9954_c0_g2_i1.p1 TRINITY_DN9954_c0_g2~~TRINITY_DN9954_c0_g2_i1.p1  ORF type:complete len:446 (+),score=73.35 TRINITY_DN9954_c0_g2_i1:142-1479(+)